MAESGQFQVILQMLRSMDDKINNHSEQLQNLSGLMHDRRAEHQEISEELDRQRRSCDKVERRVEKIETIEATREPIYRAAIKGSRAIGSGITLVLVAAVVYFLASAAKKLFGIDLFPWIKMEH